MKSKPILFTAPMVRALLDGTKTQTRRLIKTQPIADKQFAGGYYIPPTKQAEGRRISIEAPYAGLSCLHGQPGDNLWVRENFSGPHCMDAKEGCAATPPGKWGRSSSIWYWADGEPQDGDWTKPRPSIFMPRWASRISLEITAVRVERLKDISEADALAEGIAEWARGACAVGNPYGYSAVDYYSRLWNSINGDGAWDANPWVWCIEFRRLP